MVLDKIVGHDGKHNIKGQCENKSGNISSEFWFFEIFGINCSKLPVLTTNLTWILNLFLSILNYEKLCPS